MKRYTIAPNTADSHQATPWAIACFLPYKYPDTFDLPSGQQTNANALAVTRLVVVSDILSLNVNTSKSGTSTTASMMLSSGDINYGSALCPGDHVFLWMHNDIGYYDSLSKSIYNFNQSNGFKSGLKFVGKVNAVREILTTSVTGTKTLRYMVTMKAFTEFDSQVYFNPLLASADEDALRLYAKISDQWNSILAQFGKTGSMPIADIMTFFIDVFFGLGPASTQYGTITRSPNDAFLIPPPVANLLGATIPSKQALSYSDILDTIFGIQKYSTNSFMPDLTAESQGDNQKDTTVPLYGSMISLPDNFNNISIWSLLDAHKNSTLNEMYITLRADQYNDIVPTLVIRQQPLTSSLFTDTVANTPFLSVPRWVIDDRMVMAEYNIGTTDATRCNFLQVYGQLYGERTDPQASQQQQILDGNYVFNRADVIRSGSRNFILSSNADVQSQAGNAVTSIHQWAKLLGDWYMNMHLKLNGTITMPGVYEPICVGDNLEHLGIVFQIEGVSHSYNCSEQGIKTFTTTVSLSNGILANGKYAYTRSHNTHSHERGNLQNQAAPGFSDEETYISDKIIVSALDGQKRNQ